MTTGTNPKALPAAWRRWALDELNLAPDVSDADARRSVLEQLGEMDFMPPAGWDSALRTSGLVASPREPASVVYLPVHRAAEETARKQVEAFAAAFWRLSPVERAKRFNAVLARCQGSPAMLPRLEDLRAGLNLPSEITADVPPLVGELVSSLRGVFVLGRHERAAKRLTFLRAVESDIDAWQEAARTLQSSYPHYAVLDPALVDRLATWRQRERRRTQVRDKRRRKPVATSAPRRRWNLSWPESKGSYVPYWVFFLILANALRFGCSSGTTSNNSQSNRPIYQPQPPSIRADGPDTKARQDLDRLLRRSSPFGPKGTGPQPPGRPQQ
jgi:hypothetical protein